MGVEVFQNMLTSVTLFFVCYYFARKASVLLSESDQKCLIVFLRITGVVCLLLFLLTAIFQGLEFQGQYFSRMTI